MSVVDRSGSGVRMTGRDGDVRLAYCTRKQLLLRIHQLHVATSVDGASGPGEDCTLELRVRGARRKAHRWKELGWGGAFPDEIAARLSGPALAELVRTVDLAACTASWTARTRRWRVCIAPYGGHHLRLLLPPMTYTNTLTELEATTAALHELADALAGWGASG
ncbi:hypothetical protein [Salinifilum ghardaiensis]